MREARRVGVGKISEVVECARVRVVVDEEGCVGAIAAGPAGDCVKTAVAAVLPNAVGRGAGRCGSGVGRGEDRPGFARDVIDEGIPRAGIRDRLRCVGGQVVVAHHEVTHRAVGNGVAHAHADIGQAGGRDIDLRPVAFASVQRSRKHHSVIERIRCALLVFVAAHDAHVARAERRVEEGGVGTIKERAGHGLSWEFWRDFIISPPPGIQGTKPPKPLDFSLVQVAPREDHLLGIVPAHARHRFVVAEDFVVGNFRGETGTDQACVAEILRPGGAGRIGRKDHRPVIAGRSPDRPNLRKVDSVGQTICRG